MIEVEIKIKLMKKEFEQIPSMLSSLGFSDPSKIHEIDIYYNGIDRHFAKTDEGLRIRTSENLNTHYVQSYVTYKGKKLDRFSKTRLEYDVAVDDGPTMNNLLQSLGFKEVYQVEKIREKLLEQDIESVEFHEPAGSPMADAIRTVSKNSLIDRYSMTDALLFSAARHELWNRLSIPALKMGKWVVAARNWYSTLAYQGYGEDLDLETIERLTLMSTDEQYMNPDISAILDLDDETERIKRIGNRGELENPDTFESRDDIFQKNVREGYLKIAKDRNIPIISANQTVEKISEDLWQLIKQSRK